MPRGWFHYCCLDCREISLNCPQGCCQWCRSPHVVPEEWIHNPLSYGAWRQRLRPQQAPPPRPTTRRSTGIGVDLTGAEPVVYFTGAKAHWPPTTEREYLMFRSWRAE